MIPISSFARAETLSGTVSNATSNKPATGDEIVLIRLAQGMEEVDRTKVDTKGNFSFKLDDAGAPYLLRAIHQGVTYHRMAPPGTTSVELQVYDVAKKVQELNVTADVLRIQATGGSLQVVRRFAISNSSNPPRTQMNDQNFEFYLPEGAQLDSGMAKTSSGQPVNSAPVPQIEKNRYAFIFPLRPGQTEFQVTYHMPYSGSASVDPKALYPTQHFVVVLPKGMQFSAGGSSFQPMQDPGQSDTLVQVATNTQLGQSLTFRVSGTGTLPERGDTAASGAQTEGGMGANESRAATSTRPSNSDSAMSWFAWAVLGALALVLVGIAISVSRRPKIETAARTTMQSLNVDPSPMDATLSAPTQDSVIKAEAPARSGLLFNALKEELFQLEVEHKQGLISSEEYTKAKSALDQTLERAIKREVKT